MTRNVTPPSQLLHHLKKQVGRQLRSFARYDDDGIETSYVRSDITPQQASRRMRVSKHIYESEKRVFDSDTLDAGFGNIHASVHYFDGGILIHLLTENEYDVIFSVERSVGSGLSNFLRECSDQLD
ncbi:hypothetical protein SAMN04487949_1869 [Halogranum gelatinilyticum]|uniref:Uncharacterized protein n=1 Tax=Halogranum gelatinilyticum TaxID=660521 RepID=A0A1G9TQJ8_9EURY|nr:hypothetical protein [Halogranum gelatinilyticum]SDM50046.1 hypothetical protein SAMN04487949_1869 [Halogranum gelatinilyticum]